MNRWQKTSCLMLLALMVAIPTTSLAEVMIGDITHLQGSRINRLEGWGLVGGLAGTGDGGDYAPTMRALAQVHKHFANPVVVLEELEDVDNVAIVLVEATLPRDGAREGETIEVTVSSFGPAESLKGGRLLPTPLVGPNPDDSRIWGIAGGPIHLTDEEVPTVGRIAQGATLERNWVHNYIANGRELLDGHVAQADYLTKWIRADEPYITFVIDPGHAEFRIAYMIAQAINESEALLDTTGSNTNAQIARAFDPRTVIVRLPATERDNPAPFLARLESLPVRMPFTEARVNIDRKSGTIVISGDVEIAPTVITHKGLTITTVKPELPPTLNNPKVEQSDWAALDPQNKAGAKLQNLLDALNQLKVPAQDKITIIERLHEMGKLHANLMVER